MCVFTWVWSDNEAETFPDGLPQDSVLRDHLDLYLKSIPYKPYVFSQLLRCIDNFLNRHIVMIEGGGSF